MKEYELIKHVAKNFKRSREQHNDLFECDAEIITIGNQEWGLSMDDFSPEEDLFASEDPVILGVNLVVATLSDLLAAGVEPRFFMQSLSLPVKADKSFVEGLVEGIRKTLEAAGCFLCGGDMGRADTWRYCALGMGPVISGNPLTHRLPPEPYTIWITGSLGDANLAVLRKTATPEFELRLQEAEIIRRFASACIDTSGGFFDAVWVLREQNPHMKFEIDLKNIPYAEGAVEISGRLGIPPESALLGGAGEYELLFAVPEYSAVDELLSAGMTLVGTVHREDYKGVKLKCRDGSEKIMTQPPLCPREAPNIDEYIQKVMDMSYNLFR